ncbi:DNA-binding response OmpR family regulator [Aquimarina sp. EL_43]|uniref:response regulator transcription factor n=1 Tax=Aquimarina TaxID=290174 RepID=UPI00046E719A|nr:MULTISPECIES: response regulator transcription factor [Aquimarina]MBG6131456.1 DNA-binding response OmpR family regulator [Aquimarina sp. EL_35]MBG6151661.1 DNA-binding response OmpR family regulator [Aquimarina sp. EL_32]MBG6169591.1 DNA-binding response OmpR family regulator [Aquimarina sp. EL_43]
MKIKLLMVEDEQTLSELLTEFLQAEGYTVYCASDGEEGLHLFNNISPDICIFDVMMPRLSGFSLLEKIRAIDVKTPILMLTAKALKEDIINGLNLGADDYLVKPFNFQELSLRIKNILKRTVHQNNQNIYNLGKYKFNHNSQVLEFKSKKQVITTMEANILNLLCAHKNETVERKYILQNLWNNDDFYNFRSIDVFVSKLRTYLREDDTIKIISVRGKGYKLIV